MAGRIEIRVQKLRDKELVSKLTQFAIEVEAQGMQIKLDEELVCNDPHLPGTMGEGEQEDLDRLANIDGTNLAGTVSISNHAVHYLRDRPFDLVKITIPNAQQRNFGVTAAILEGIRRHFDEIELNETLVELFDSDTKRYYEHREAALTRLEQLSEKLINDNEAYRLKIDQEKSDYQSKVDTRYQEKVKALDTRAKQLDQREEDMELADAKSARRKLRNDLVEKLGKSEGIKLTRGQQTPIHVLFLTTAAGLATLLVAFLMNENFDLSAPASSLKVGLTSAGLTGTLMLYYRWIDSWLRRSVDEGLRIAQLGIDIDRSTWIVEVLSEVKDETDHTIPEEILNALTRNLFVGTNKSSAVTHPAEDILASLMTSSREIEVDLPGGKIRTDGRRIKNVVNETEG